VTAVPVKNKKTAINEDIADALSNVYKTISSVTDNETKINACLTIQRHSDAPSWTGHQVYWSIHPAKKNETSKRAPRKAEHRWSFPLGPERGLQSLFWHQVTSQKETLWVGLSHE
jgi:hypothetical protein